MFFKVFIKHDIVLREISLSRIIINNSFLSNKLNIKISLPILINTIFIEEDIIYTPLTASLEV